MKIENVYSKYGDECFNAVNMYCGSLICVDDDRAIIKWNSQMDNDE